MEILKLVTGLTLMFVLASLTIVLAVVWNMEDLPAVLVTKELCLHTEQGNSECSNTLLSDYLRTAVSKEYYRTKQAEKDRFDAYFSDERNMLNFQSAYGAGYRKVKPTARITGKKSAKKLINKEATDMEPIRDWSHGKDLSTYHGFLYEGIRYHKGRLVVPVSGTYFIYSYVDLYESCIPDTGKPNVEDISIPLKHGIYKFNIFDDEEIKLVQSYQPHKFSLNRYFNRYSSYITTLAELKAGDEISVKVSNITNIEYADNNFFGINLI